MAHESDTFSEDSVLVGRFTNPHTPDVAVGISFPPYRGNLVILREIDGRYVPMEPIVGLGFIESMQAVQLFPATASTPSVCPWRRVRMATFRGGPLPLGREAAAIDLGLGLVTI